MKLPSARSTMRVYIEHETSLILSLTVQELDRSVTGRSEDVW